MLLAVQLFSALSFASITLLTFITVAVTAGSITGERERRTLDLLLVTRASALGLVSGKLASSLLHVLFLLVASLPAFALVYLCGGVPPGYFLRFFLVAVATASFYGALGLLLSAWLRRTVLASVLSFVIVLGLVLAVPIAAGVSRQANRANESQSQFVSSTSGWTGYAPGYAPLVFLGMRGAG